MDMWMDVDAALAEVPVNLMPLIDDTDFKTIEDALTYDQAGMDLRWNFVTTAGAVTSTAVTPTSAGVHDWTNQGDGLYSLEIPSSGGTVNNDTEGFGWFSGKMTGVLPFRGPVIGFRAAGLNDLMIDNAYSTTRGLSGTALPAAAADAAGGLPISDAGGLDMDSVKADTAAILVDTGTTLDGRIPAALVSGRMDASVGAVAANAITAAAIATGAIDADAIAADAVTEIQAGLALDATVAKDATVSKPGTAQTISSNADITAIKAKTDTIPTSPAAVGDAMTLTIAYDAAKTAASAANLAIVDGVVDAILVDTDAIDARLPVDPADESALQAAIGTRSSQTSVDTLAGYVDSEVAAIKAQTDQLVFSAGAVQADAVQISGDSGAADALESQFDGTGLSGAAYPSRQDQLSNLAVTGAAINAAATGFVLTTGVQTGTFANTLARDGLYHLLEDSAGTLDGYYEFNVTAKGVPTSFLIFGHFNGINDVFKIHAWDWVGSNWVQIGTIQGVVSTADVASAFNAYISMVGTGVNLGNVRLRVEGTVLTSADAYINQLYVSYAVVNQTVGYADGAVWVDTINGTAGTTPYYNGTADKPVLTYADAITIAAAVNLHRFKIIAGSSITLANNHDGDSFVGSGGQWTVALASQSISGAYFESADVSGVGTGSTPPTFRWCAIVGATTLPPSFFDKCGFNTTSGAKFVAGAAGQYLFADCISMVAGSGTPYFDFSGTGGTTGINFRRWSGGSNVTLDSNCTMTMEVVTGGGQTVAVGAAAGVEIRGITRSVTLTGITSATTAQIDCVTGPISVAGADGTVRVYGVCATVTDTRTGSPTLTNEALSQVTIPVSVWAAGTRTLSSFGTLVADAATAVWASVSRTLTDKLGFSLTSAYDPAKTAASAANLAIVDGIVDDILADSAALDLRLPVSPAAVGSAMTLSSGERSTLADTIWDEILSGHSGAGSAGLALSNAGGALDAAATAAAVWGALRATYSGSGTFGEYSRASLERVAGSATVDTLTITAWFETILAHAAGDVVRSVNTYDYKKQDGVTTAFSFTSSAGGRS